MLEKPGLKSRLVAAQCLQKWEDGRGFLVELISRQSNLCESDRSLALELALGVCRQKSLLDFQLQKLCKNSPRPFLRQILRLAIYQIVFMADSIPSYSAVDTAVDLAAHHSSHFKGFVNAVLRRFLREGMQSPQQNDHKSWAIRYSHPEWLIRRWRKLHGDQIAIQRLIAASHHPNFWLRRNQSKLQLENWRELDFHNEELWERFGKTKQPLRLILNSQAFLQGLISIQDPAAWLMTRLLRIQPHENHLLLDACAAPGGKSALLLEEFPNLQLIATDLKWLRLAKMTDLNQRLNLSFSLLSQDMLAPAFKAESFDRILLDVPCSNLGVLGRRPEARWTVTEHSLNQHAQLQGKILKQSAPLLRPGGILVYGTCSPEPEETTHIIQHFLAEHSDFELLELPPEINPEYSDGSFLKIIPHIDGLDGFFGAALKKKE